MHKLAFKFLILLGCVFFASCLDDNVTSPETKKNDKFQNGTLTSLEGTVWIHHPDTDPESYNWVHLVFSPIKGYETIGGVYPAEITFTKDRILDGTVVLETQRQYYTYEYPKVLLTPDYHCVCPNPMSYNKNTECMCYEITGYWGGLRFGFLGYVNETCDTMKLRRYDHYNDSNKTEYLYKDVVLIRIK